MAAPNLLPTLSPLARGFGATHGVGSTDRIEVALPPAAVVQTLALWSYRAGDGGANLGRLFQRGPEATIIERLFNDPSNGRYHYSRGFSTTLGQWGFARPSASAWHALLIAHDASSTANDPVIYVDAASVTVTEISAPAGTALTTTDTMVIGNRNDLIRVWDGLQWLFARWDRLLSDKEAVEHFKYGPYAVPLGLVAVLPLGDPDVADLGPLARPGKVFGTKVKAGPVWLPPTLPTGRRWLVGSAAQTFSQAVGGTLALSGTAVPQAQKALAGGVAAAGAIARLTSRAFAGGASFAGAVTAVRVFLAAVDGALAFAGALGRLPQKALAGTLALAGALTTTTARALAGTLAFTGTAAVRAGKALAGALGLDGTLATAAQFVHVLAGGLAFAGQTGKRVAQAISGAIGFLGSLVGLNLGQRSPYIDADTVIVAYNAETPAAVAYGAESGAATAYTLETPSTPTYTEEPQP